MTAYANLRNVLANAYAANYYGDNDMTNDASCNMTDALSTAFAAYEDDVYDKCKTSRDWDNSLAKIEKGIRRAASTASKHDKTFVVEVLRDYYDADFYGLEIDA